MPLKTNSESVTRHGYRDLEEFSSEQRLYRPNLKLPKLGGFAPQPPLLGGGFAPTPPFSNITFSKLN